MPGFLKLCYCCLPEPLLSLAGGRRKRRGGIVVMDLGAHSVRVWCSLASLA